MTAGRTEKYKVEKQNFLPFLSHFSTPRPLSLRLLEPIKCQLLFSSSRVLARCQQTLLKRCHCELKARKSGCQRCAIHLGIYNKKCDAVIKGMAPLPGIYNVNKRNIKMFILFRIPQKPQDGLTTKRKRRNVILTVINEWGFFSCHEWLLCANRKMKIYGMDVTLQRRAKRAGCSTRLQVKGKHHPDTH